MEEEIAQGVVVDSNETAYHAFLNALTDLVLLETNPHLDWGWTPTGFVHGTTHKPVPVFLAMAKRAEAAQFIKDAFQPAYGGLRCILRGFLREVVFGRLALPSRPFTNEELGWVREMLLHLWRVNRGALR